MEVLCTPEASGEIPLRKILYRKLGKNPDVKFTEFDLICTIYQIDVSGNEHPRKSQREISQMLQINEGNVTRARDRVLRKLEEAVNAIEERLST